MEHRRRFSAFVASGENPRAAIVEATEFTRDFMSQAGLSARAKVKTLIVVEELVSNVLRHLRFYIICPSHPATGNLCQSNPGEAGDLKLKIGGLHGSWKSSPISHILTCLNMLGICMIILLICMI